MSPREIEDKWCCLCFTAPLRNCVEAEVEVAAKFCIDELLFAGVVWANDGGGMTFMLFFSCFCFLLVSISKFRNCRHGFFLLVVPVPPPNILCFGRSSAPFKLESAAFSWLTDFEDVLRLRDGELLLDVVFSNEEQLSASTRESDPSSVSLSSFSSESCL